MPRHTRSNSAGDQPSTSTSMSSEITNLYKLIEARLEAQQNIFLATQRELQNNLQLTQTQLQSELKNDLKELQNTQREVNTKLDSINSDVQNLRTQFNEQFTDIRTEQTLAHDRLNQIQKVQDTLEERVHGLDDRLYNSLQDLGTQIQGVQTNAFQHIQKVDEEGKQSAELIRSEYNHKLQLLNQEVDSVHVKIDSVVQSADETRDKFEKEATNLQNRIESIIERERTAREQLEKKIELIKRQGTLTIPADSSMTNLFLKPEMWPRFRGHKDKLHPMTYLKNVRRLTANTENPDIALNLIRISLEERALEWYESICDRITDVEEFSEYFKKQYWNRGQQDRVKIQLMTGRYRIGLLKRETYACDMYNKCKHIDGISEREIVQNIMRHFILTDPATSISPEIQSLDELMEILRRLDEVAELQRNQRMEQDTRPPINNPIRNFQSLNTHPQNETFANRRNGQNGRHQGYNNGHNYQTNNHRPNEGYRHSNEYQTHSINRGNYHNTHNRNGNFNNARQNRGTQVNHYRQRSRSPPESQEWDRGYQSSRPNYNVPEQKKTPILEHATPSTSKQ